MRFIVILVILTLTIGCSIEGSFSSTPTTNKDYIDIIVSNDLYYSILKSHTTHKKQDSTEIELTRDQATQLVQDLVASLGTPLPEPKPCTKNFTPEQSDIEFENWFNAQGGKGWIDKHLGWRAALEWASVK